jgi:hypothetical protein
MRKLILAFLGVTLTALAVFAAEKGGEAPALEVVGRFTLPEKAGEVLVDVHWASKDSIYLADLHGGVTEVKLKEGLPEIRRITPPAEQIGLPVIQHVAISDKWMVAAHEGRLAWKAMIGGDWAVKKNIGLYHDFDIRGDEIVMLGVPDHESSEHSPAGVVWRANLSKGLEGSSRWDVLYESPEVARDETLMWQDATLGSVRFLPQGGVVVAPNFLPGVWLFSTSGGLKQRWSPEELWGAEEGPEPSAVSGEEKGWKRGDVIDQRRLQQILAARRTVDEVLPLHEGPAIIVREPRAGQARYRLGVLGAEIRWYDIPIRNVTALARLRGDADENGRIVLMGVERGPMGRLSSNEIFILRLPQ